MKFKHIFALLACAAATLGCDKHMEYDISEGYNKEITLFEDEISVPLGNVGPITIHTIIKDGLKRLFGDMADRYITIDSDGYLWFESEDNMLNTNVYELNNERSDPSQPYDWNPSFVYTGPGGIAPLLGLFGMSCVNQKVGIYAQNPLSRDITLNSTAKISCRNNSYETTHTDSSPLKDFKVESGSNAAVLALFDVPADCYDVVGDIRLDDLHVSLPANITKRITSDSQLFFRFYSKYKSNVTIGDKLAMNNMAFPIRNLNVPLEQFRLHKCNVSFDVVSTLPLDVTIVKAEVLKEESTAEGSTEEPVVDENISISSDVKILGGDPDKPSTSNVELQIAAQEGIIPDIKSVRITVSVKASEGYANTILNTNQGISIKNATAKISGGITLPL